MKTLANGPGLGLSGRVGTVSEISAKCERLVGGASPRVLDLFAGCGGFSLGFRAAGYEIVAGVENDPDAVASYAGNLHQGIQGHARPRDVTLTTPDALCGELDLGPPRLAVDVIIAGPPCQAFARVGRAKLRALVDDPHAFLNDPRAGLHEHWLGWVAALKPLAIVIENVPDILNLRGWNLADDLAAELEALGFVCRYTLLNAVHYGVPQTRQRMILVGMRQELGATPTFPQPTNRHLVPRGYEGSRRVALRNILHTGLFADRYWTEPPDGRPDLPQAVTVREAIGDLPAICPMADPTARRGARRFNRPSPYRLMVPSDYARLMRTWPGFEAPPDGPRDHVVRHLPRDWPIFAAMRPGDEYPAALRIAERLFAERLHAAALAGRPVETSSDRWNELRRATVPPYKVDRFPNKWWKLDPERPSRTLMAHLGKDSYSHIHWDDAQARPISVREAARLQSFPDGFVFAGTMNPAFRQIGNAVPPLLAKAIAASLREALMQGAARAASRTATAGMAGAA